MYRDDYPDRFFEGPALSFSHQPFIEELFDRLLDPDQEFTIVVGAGASLDAGMPSWPQLIANMADLISADRWRELALADTTELMRKADLILRLAMQYSSTDKNQIVRDALYPREENAIFRNPTPGRLTDVIARLASSLGDRVRVATTNFDVLIEDAMHEYQDENAAPPGVESLNHPEGDAPPVLDSWTSNSVLHLHGVLEPRKAPSGTVILTEADFLQYGPRVRKIVKDRLENSNVIFVGVSLTDPNLITPLWDLRASAGSSHDKEDHTHYVLAVASANTPGADYDDARAYSIKSAMDLSTAFGVRTIFTKSYSQQIQLLSEACYAIQRPEYMISKDPDTDLRYGFRLKRFLSNSYAAIGCDEHEDAPVGEKASGLSDQLHRSLISMDEGMPYRIFSDARSRLGRANDPRMRELATRHMADFEKEKMGLFLWLRSRRANSSGEYDLRLVGTSVYTHREQWSIDREAKVISNSRFHCARASFYGRPFIEDVPQSQSGFQLWHTIRAIPFSVYSASGSRDSYAGLDAIDIGVITLNSRSFCWPHGEEWDTNRPRSIMSILDNEEANALNDSLASIANSLVNPDAT